MKPNVISRVVTDSAGQVPKEEADQLGIEVIPLEIYINGKQYRDGIDFTPRELYQKMRTDDLEVKTAAPGVGQYYEFFKKMQAQGADEILCVSLSNQLSSAYTCAMDAAKMINADNPTKKVVVYDCLTAAVPQGLLAIEAANHLNVGEPVESVVKILKEARQRTGLIAAVDTLKYLARGGRIGKASYLFGSALRIIPLLTVNEEGIVAPKTIVRSKGKIIPTILNMVHESIKGYQRIRLAVIHADALAQAQALRQALLDLYPDVSIPIEEFTPVMGAHTGPGLFGLGYIYE